MITGHTHHTDSNRNLPIPEQPTPRAGILPDTAPAIVYTAHSHQVIEALQRAGHVDFIGHAGPTQIEPSSSSLRDMSGRMRIPQGGIGSVVNKSRTRPTR